MNGVYRKLYVVLSPHERRRAVFVFLVMLAIACSEVLGVASVMPFIAVLSNPSVIQTNEYLARAYGSLGFQSTENFLFFLGAVFFGLLIGTLLLRGISLWVQLRFTQNRNKEWSARLVTAYLRQPYEWFLNRHSSEMTSSILLEVNNVVAGALLPAMQAIAQALVALLLLVLLIVVDPILALSVGVVFGGGYTLIAALLRRKQVRLGAERRTANRARMRVVQEALGGIKDVKIAGLESRFLAEFRRQSGILASRQISSGLLSQLPSLAMQALLFGGMMLVLLYLIGSHGSFQQALPVIALYALAGYRLMPAAQKVYEESSKLRFAEAALDALADDLITLEASAVAGPDVEKGAAGRPRLGLGTGLSLQSISFQYSGATRKTLDEVSIDVPTCHSIGLVGATGSGKTTLVDIVLGLLEPHAGAIVVDGQRLVRDSVRAWQRSIGYVPQQIFLADDSVAGNIAFGVPEARIDMAAVERAARIANLHDFVVRELPDGYRTHVGERGVRLSGGQRQRIGIARALYHDPDVLILDEATSALDNLTEHAVMEAVNNLARRKTIIMIAHRLSTVRHCDCIYMLEQGKVIGSGTYEELLASNEQFRRMAESA